MSLVSCANWPSYLSILEKQIKPCLTEMLQALSEQYGEAVLSDYEDIIKELVS